MAREKRHPSDISRNVLQDPARTKEQAAWQLLYAICELFPERLKALREIGERFASAYIHELPEEDPENRQALSGFERAVDEWTEWNRIRCPTTIDAAREFACGGSPSAGLYLDAHFDASGQLVIADDGITAYPYNETRYEFLKKAGAYYDRLAERYMRDGATRGPVKRDLEHFRYLAAHLVGGYTWAELAYGDTPLQLPRGEQQSVADGARRVAKLIGILLAGNRGPRKGTRRHRRLGRR